MTYPHVVIKGHGTGNDFVLYVDETGNFEPTAQEVRFLCDRHFGIGADGLIRLTHPQYVSDVDDATAQDLLEHGAEWFMDYRNADGSLAQMCGNGTRVTAALAVANGFTTASEDKPFALGTRSGIKYLTSLGVVDGLGENVYRIDMGPWTMGRREEYAVTLPGKEETGLGTFVDMGNPHVVSVVKEPVNLAHAIPGIGVSFSVNSLPDVEHLDLTRTPRVDPELDNGQNAEFVRIDTMDKTAGEGKATMRVNERGVGETLSCGTGLCATGVVLRERTGISDWRITVPGGTLIVNVEDSRVYLTGDAKLVAKVEVL